MCCRPLPLRQRRQPRLHGLAVHHRVQRRVHRPQRVTQRVPVLAAGQLRVQGQRREALQRLQAHLDVLLAHLRVRGDFGHGGPAAGDGLGQVLGGEAHAVAQVLDAAGHVQGPHVVAEVPLDLAGDGRHRVALERVAARGVVPVDGLDQAEGRDLPQVLEALAAAAEASGETVRHGQPGFDDLVPEGVALRAGGHGGEPAEGLGGVGGVVVRVLLRAGSGRHDASQFP